MAWAPDDKTIAYMGKVDGVNQIFTVPVDGSAEPTQLTHSAEGKDDAAWMADGKSIIYWVNSTGVKQIYQLSVTDPQEPGRRIVGPEFGPANDPAPSPDGSQILYTRELNGGKTSDIWLVRADGTNPRRVTSSPAREMDPSWSPDGTWFTFARGDWKHPTIVVARPDGSDEKLLTPKGAIEAHPGWF